MIPGISTISLLIPAVWGSTCLASEVVTLGLGGEGLAPEEGLTAPYRTAFPWRRSQDMFPVAAIVFSCSLLPVSAPSHPCIATVCLNLPFGAQGKSRSWMEAYFLQIRNRDMERICPWEGLYRVPLTFSSLICPTEKTCLFL